MTYDRDYILRMVREFATFLARIVGSTEDRSAPGTIADLDEASRRFVGLGLDVLEALPSDQLTMMLSIGGSLDVHRAYASGRILEERAAMADGAGRDEGAGDRPASAALRSKAMHLLATSALAFGAYLNDEHREALARVEDRRLEAAPALDSALLCSAFDVHLRHDERDRVVRLAEALLARSEGARDRTEAVRIALAGRCAELLGRAAEVLDRTRPAGPSSD